jgi:predicted metalloprotease with PDZ domain
MDCHIYQEIPTSQYIQVKLSIECTDREKITLQLPAWRPGRYELANFAQKIRRVVVSTSEETVPFKKTTKDTWEFVSERSGTYTVSYEYYCNQLDAGGCWADPEMLYLNFSNLAFSVSNREKEEIHLQLHLPDAYQVATSLPQLSKHQFKADTYQQLIDSPLIASPDLQHFTYHVGMTTFHLWLQGEIHFNTTGFIDIFRSFTARQIAAFADFPAEEYHFLFLLLPYIHSHGVEHQFSTVVTYGPAESLANERKLAELISVSSHELYHFWNVCRIRPSALLPYELSKEAYLREGVVAEGVTTYLGDMYLLRAGYYTIQQYVDILAQKINRETMSHGWQYQSIVDSSFDLWLDGYKAGIPDKKVSIYNRGALISLCLDLLLMDRDSSLEDVMRCMWIRYGRDQKGFLLEDFQQVVTEYAQDSVTIEEFFRRFVFGTEDLLPLIEETLRSVNIYLRKEENQQPLEEVYGIQLDDSQKIIRLHPDSPAYRLLMLGDTIESIEKKATSVKLEIKRVLRKKHVSIPTTNRVFFIKYKLATEEVGNEKRARWIL